MDVHIIFICLSVDGHLWCGFPPHFLAVVNSAAMNGVAVLISLRDPDFSSFGQIPISGIAGSNDNSIFNFLKYLYIVYHTVPFFCSHQ